MKTDCGGGIEVWCGDSIELLNQINDPIAAIVTDPPYGMAYQSGWRTVSRDRIVGDDTTDIRDRVLDWAHQRHLPAICFGTWTQPRPGNVRHRLIWSKAPNPGMGDLKLPWGCSDEEIYIIGDGWVTPDQRRPNIIEVPTVPSNAPSRVHPTPKPVALMRHLVERCPPGLIVDPFAGSGATLQACKDLNRPAIGIEYEQRYADLAVDGLRQQTLQFT